MLPELPSPSTEALEHSQKLVAFIQEKIRATPQQMISFADYMHLALYAPGLGYYSAGSQKFGASGDFTTAPEISPLFGQCIANQCAEVFATFSTPTAILELGGGSGALAKSILQHLEAIQQLPTNYAILEVSPDLQVKQQQFLREQLSAPLFEKCIWLDTLPTRFSGIIIANEVLDALAVRRFEWTDETCYEVFVDANLQEKLEVADAELTQRVNDLQKEWGAWPAHYHSEINQQMDGLVRSLANTLTQGMILFIDYGFPAREYYHFQRNTGTLVCHYRHHVHADPYFYPGLQDITAHVDFTRVAKVADENGLEIAGYTTQAGFLLGSGLMDITPDLDNLAAQLKINQQIQLLTSPAEMGELFKVIALNKNCAAELLQVDFFKRDL